MEIFTPSNERQPHAEAIAVRKDRIAFVGANDDARKLANEKTRVVDLHGATVVPGLTDSHCHIFGIGEREMTLNLEGTNTREDFLAKVKERGARISAAANGSPAAAGSKHSGNRQRSRHARISTKIAPEQSGVSHASRWSRRDRKFSGIKIAGVTRETANPFGGEILKDKNGEPTGMLLDNAQDLVESKIPKPTEAEREQALLLGVKREIALGWCEIQNAGSELADQAIIRRAFEAKKSNYVSTMRLTDRAKRQTRC